MGIAHVAASSHGDNQRSLNRHRAILDKATISAIVEKRRSKEISGDVHRKPVIDYGETLLQASSINYSTVSPV